MALTPGTRLGPYEILGPLGSGGMGEVYRARDTRLNRDVAVKVLPERMAADPDALGRFEREARAVAALSHPNILAIHDFGVEAGTAYSVSEMLVGQTLRERMGGAALPGRKAVQYAVQVARGLAAAHEKGIIHRDLKPENIFVTDDGQVKILDFGLAKVWPASPGDMTGLPTADEGTRPGTVMGTTAYMSPEQVRGQAVDHRTDIFSFGAVLYEMVSGRQAFRRGTAADTMSAILREDPPELSVSGVSTGVSRDLERIVGHCLEKNQAERFQAARDLAFNLEAVSTGVGVALPEAKPVIATPAAAHRRLLAGVGTGLAAGLVAGAGLVLWLAPEPRREPPTLRYLSYSGLDRQPSASPDGRLIAYTSVRQGRAQIWLKQYPGGDEVALTSGPFDSNPRISPDGSQILFARLESGVESLFRIPVLGGEPRRILTNALQGDWSPDGERIVFLRLLRDDEGASTLVGIAGASGESERVIATMKLASLDSPRWSPDGSTIAVTNVPSENAPHRILLIGMDGTIQRTLVPPPPSGSLSSVAWSGGSIVYALLESIATGGQGGAGRIIRQDAQTGEAETIQWIPGMVYSVDVLGPGRLVMGVSVMRQNLYEISPAEGPSTGRWLTHGNSVDRQPAFSRDGQWILFSSNRSGNLDIWKLSTSTGAIHRITEDPADDWDPAFTPDGRQILWSSSRSGHFEIWICSADGTGARQLTNDGVDAENPTATADGRWVVYNSSNPAGSGIWKIRPDGTGATRLVPGTWSTPDVSPDGSHVAFRTAPTRTIQVARVEDGRIVGSPIELPGDNRNGRPRWSPDGRSVMFTGSDETGAFGIYAQRTPLGPETASTRRSVAGFDMDSALETFGISPDGKRLVYSTVDLVDSLMLAEGLPGVQPRQVRAR